MTKIEEVYRDYYQKSKMFMYPLLGIKRGNSIVPCDSYMIWHNEFGVQDQKFICTYYLRDDNEFKTFEEVKLLKNPLFHEFIELEEDNLGAYVFDMSEEDDYTKICAGKYSKISGPNKKKILDFVRDNLSNFTYMESFLHPEMYMKQYARILTNKIEDRADMYTLLQKVGELYSLPDLERETLFAKKKVLDFQINDVHLSD